MSEEHSDVTDEKSAETTSTEETPVIQFMGKELNLRDEKLRDTLTQLEAERERQDAEREKAYRRGLSEQGAELGQLRQTVAQLKETYQAPPVQNYEDLDDEFLSSPSKAIQQLRQEYDKKYAQVVSYVKKQEMLREGDTFINKFFKDNSSLDTELGRKLVDGVCSEPEIMEIGRSGDTVALTKAIADRAKEILGKANIGVNKKPSASLESSGSRSVAKEEPEEEGGYYDPFEKVIAKARAKW